MCKDVGNVVYQVLFFFKKSFKRKEFDTQIHLYTLFDVLRWFLMTYDFVNSVKLCKVGLFCVFLAVFDG